MRTIVMLTTLLVVGTLPLTAQDQAAPPDGAQLFDLVCAMCHSVNPPHKAAPPMSHAAAYYLQKHADADSALVAMVAYLKAPTAERSALPPMATERFGVMPSQAHLSDAQLQAVARYALSLADTTHVHGQHGQMRGHDR